MITKLLKALKEAKDEDFKVLRVIELLMRYHEWVPLDEIVRKAKMPEKDVLYRLNRLSKFEFVVRSTYGYAVSMGGYDALAINALVKKGILKAIGNKLGVGKEGDVYNVLLNDDRVAVLKFHKHGRTCFTRGKRYRDYLADKHHISWLYVSRLSAEREFNILNELYPLVKVPEPIAWNRHAIIMGKVEGEELKRIDLSEILSREEIEELFWKIIEEVKKAYKIGYIHGDLSEFNIIYNGEDFVIIDWPQAVPTYHPEARFYLKRDIENVVRYFKKYKVEKDVDELFKYITEVKD
ncbi:RIO1 family regulatory kinase/ATPase domain-containing protein [Methanocaldococcus infernus]